MVVRKKITVDGPGISDSLYLHDKKEYPFIVNRVSDICLTKFVEMTMNDQYGDPLRLLPFQSVMLHMMWFKKFPMILACRGAGKCQVGPSLIQLSDGMYRFDELIGRDTLEMTKLPIDMDAYGENGPNPIEYGWNNGVCDTKIIQTKFGFECENTYEHMIRVLRGGAIEWVESQNVEIGDYVPIMRDEYQFGNDETLDADKGWWLGATVGDGCVSQPNLIKFTNIDQDIINEWTRIGEQWSEHHITGSSPSYNICKKAFAKLINEKVGLNYQKAHGKQIPLLVRRSPQNIVAAFLSGLFDTDAGMTKMGFEYSTVSEELSNQVQSCLLAFGILAKRRIKQVKYKGTRRKAYIITIHGSNNLTILRDKISFRCDRKQEALDLLCQKECNTNIDVIPHQYIQEKLLALSNKFRSLVTVGGHGYSKERNWLAPSRIKSYEVSYQTLSKILEHTKEISDEQEWLDIKAIYDQHYFFAQVISIKNSSARTYDIHIPEDHSFISNGFISHNTFMLAVYCLLKCLLIPGTKVVIVSGGFRQAKFTFQYIDTLVKASPIIQEAIRKFHPGNNFGVKFATDRVYLKVGANTEIVGIPIGDGSKVRGMRACVEPTTIVETDSGLRRIGDLVNNPEDILLHHGNNKWEKPTRFVKTAPIDAYRITTECGYEIVCSDIHRVWTDNGWKDYSEVTLGVDKIPLFLGGTFNPEEKYGEDFAWLMGAIISEGCCSNKYRISVKNCDDAFCDRVESIAKDKFGKAFRYYTPPREDPRGWTSKPGYEIHFCNLKSRIWMHKEMGLDYSTARLKKVPSAILNGSKNEVISFLTGAFDGDGTCYLYKDKTRKNNLGITYYTASRQLGKDVQVLLLKLGIICTRSVRTSKLSEHPQYMLRISGLHMLRFIKLIRPDRFVEVYNKAFLDIRFKKEKTSKTIKLIEKLDGKHVLYDFEIPSSKAFIGNGIKNHNTTLICDEVASIDDNVFDTAIGPFLSVKANPSEAVIVNQFIQRLKSLGANKKIIDLVEQGTKTSGNQMVLSGTATYQFSHFFRRYEAYRIFANSGGDPLLIKEGLRRQSRDGTINVTDKMLDKWKTIYKEYAIFSLPYHAMPDGFLDDDIVANHKAIMPPTTFGHEYECRFSKDTNGFFPRSIIDDASPGKPLEGEESFEHHFELYGDPAAQYVMGLDPARWNDNFGLVVMRLAADGAKTVYVESWNKSKWGESIKRIREVLNRFPNIVYIACDKGGGGDTIQELLASTKHLKEGERPIIEIDPESEYKAIPNAQRILEMVNFHTWSTPANHSLKADIILKKVMFPGRMDDDIVLARHAKILINEPEFDIENKEHQMLITHLNDLIYGVDNNKGDPITLGAYREMGELINELCTIIQTVTEKGSETFGLQKLTDQPDGLDVRRRDRYSALLLAAHASRMVRGHGHKQAWGTPYGGTPRDILRNSKGSGGDRPMQNRGGVAF